MSSQTMTAPAVGHRPPDPGTDTPMYDYGGSHNDASPPNDSRSDSAIRNMHNSAPASRPLPATQIGIKTEPSENQDFTMDEDQKDANAQSAAGALLAQLLGNQSAPNAGSAPGQSAGQQFEHQDSKSQDPNRLSIDQSAQSAKLFDSTFNPDSDLSKGMQDLSNGGLSAADMFAGMGMGTQEGSGGGHRLSDAMDSLSDPLNPKSNMEQPSLLPPFDLVEAPNNPFDALQHNELLTAAYLSQSADLSALGYQDGSASIAGSEPRIQAFAKLEFDDGHFYVNTYSFILGRDVRAARAAHQREIQFRQAVRSSRAKSSSGGNTSHTPNRMKREESAAMMGSVVSDRGGIMGFDPELPPPNLQNNLNISRRSSKSSIDDSAMPINPAQLQTTTSTDYNALAMQSLQEGNGEAKPVDALALLPSPDSCPTIPIHPPSTIDGTAAGHRGISRRHVRIAYNFDRSLFEMEVMGRNGAFIGADWLSPGQVRPLHSGDYIQIGGVRIRFLLPDVPIGETGANRLEEEAAEEPVEEEDAAGSVDAEHEVDDMDTNMSDSVVDSKDRMKLVLKNKDSDSRPMPSIEASGDQPAARRRGPGRPPKDGIMSKRERAELAREQKMAAKRDANGGSTPPPQPAVASTPVGTVQSRPTKSGKTPKESVVPESPTSSVKPAEKRKYNKRKKDGTMDFALPSTEGGQLATEQRPEEYVKPPPVKKRKPSRSPSPNYPPESVYTQEDLAKPPYNYAVLIFDALTEAGTPMTLKQIYRALKLKYPYFRFKCETEGWTSSVRHNLNGNGHLFMHAERDGKGWSWQLRPGASVEKEKKRRPSPPPPQPQPPQVSAPAPQPYMGPISHSYAPPAGGPPPMQAQHHNFQFPPMPSANFSTPQAAPQHSSPYATPAPPVSAAPAKPPAPTPAPAPVPAPASFPIPSTIRNNLPAAFAQTIPSTYTSPYASDPAPQSGGPQAQPAQTPRPGQGQPPPPRQSPYPPPKPPTSQPPHMNTQPQAFPPPAGSQFQPQHQQQHQQQHQHQQPAQSQQSQPQQQPPPRPHSHPHPHPPQHQHQQHQQHQHQPQHVGPPHHQAQQQRPPPPQHQPGPPPHSQPQQMSARPNQMPSGPSETSSFNERASKAIDDFEAVLMEDYEDKNYIREVLRSARARVLGNATESSFPGGEPKDEGVIMDVLRNLVGSLKDE